ncbi:hypothetical protein, partial [Streptococcus alactolyticus]|uniref:hypothetical protein n=1 Tax=Streptococcus alactolyticus TaxID=29389 RepID=UPI00195CAD7E
MMEFQEIDAKTAVDVDFFLLSTYQHSEEIPPLVGSLTLPLFALGVEIQSLNLKRMREQSRTKKRSLLGLDG